jgi:carbon monoxide dehydrogenase subunit G
VLYQEAFYMALIATINGIQVYSDKQRTNIIGSRVEFTDGSWCDVANGKISNRGPGEISIGTPLQGGSAKPITKGPERFPASSLDLRQVTASVSVEPHQDSDIEVTITGPEDEVKAIRTNVRGKTLVIEGSSRSGISGGNMVISGGSVVIGGVSTGSIISGGNSIVIGNAGNEDATKVAVKVPVGTPISVSGRGKTRIGDVRGPLEAQISASGHLKAGSMTDVDLEASSSGTIHVALVRGRAELRASSSGEVTVDDSDISVLKASASSSGEVEVDGTVQRASLSASSSGDVRVARVIEEPRQSSSSSGRVRVRRVG